MPTTDTIPTLDQLAETINAEHQACEDAVRAGLEHANRARELRTMVRRIEESVNGHHGLDGTTMSRRDAAVAIGRIKARAGAVA